MTSEESLTKSQPIKEQDDSPLQVGYLEPKQEECCVFV